MAFVTQPRRNKIPCKAFVKVLLLKQASENKILSVWKYWNWNLFRVLSPHERLSTNLGETLAWFIFFEPSSTYGRQNGRATKGKLSVYLVSIQYMSVTLYNKWIYMLHIRVIAQSMLNVMMFNVIFWEIRDSCRQLLCNMNNRMHEAALTFFTTERYMFVSNTEVFVPTVSCWRV